MKILSAALISIAICIPSVNAGELYPAPNYQDSGAEFGLIEHSELSVLDEVTNNCWTNSSTIRSKVHLLLEQNGIFVPDYVPAFYNAQTVKTELSALGFRSGNICTVSAEFRVDTIVYADFGGADGKQVHRFIYRAQIYSQSAIYTNSSNVDSQLADFFEGAASEFLAKTISARRNRGIQEFRKEYPLSQEPPLSRSEWEELVGTLPSSKN